MGLFDFIFRQSKELVEDNYAGIPAQTFRVTRKCCSTIAYIDPVFVFIMVDDRPIPFRQREHEYSRMVASLKIHVEG